MSEPPLLVWVLVDDDGSIETAHCTCVAGASEVCSHVGAVLFALEYITIYMRTTTILRTTFERMCNCARTTDLNDRGHLNGQHISKLFSGVNLSMYSYSLVVLKTNLQ